MNGRFIRARNLVCPLDGESLLGDGPLRCTSGHSFDVARQGYVNLLPVQNKKSKEPGDSKEMVAARGRFLESGCYQAIADLVNETVLANLPVGEERCVVDAGCGEGYYLYRLQQALPCDVACVGWDIAKPAVIAAARRNSATTWLVASNNNPPLSPQSVDVILCLFGFPMYEAFKKILKPHGLLVLVDAAEEHLIELREIIYPHVRKSPPAAIERALHSGFVLKESRQLRYQINNLPRELIADLLLMTPHLFRATHEGKAAAAQLQQLTLTVDVQLRVLQLG